MMADEQQDELLRDIEAARYAMDLYLNNDFKIAREMFESRKTMCLFHSLGHNATTSVTAVMAFDKGSLDESSEVCDSSVSFISTFRKQLTWTETVFGSSCELADMEIQAELIYAFSLLLKAVLTFLKDDKFSSFVKGALAVRASYRLFRSLESLMNNEDVWKGTHGDTRKHFEGGVSLGLGVFNLVMSTLPGKVLLLLEVVGFTGEKTTGLQELLQSARGQSLYSPLAALFLLSWNALGCFTFGIGNLNVEVCREMFKLIEFKYPKGFLTFYFKARLELINGQMKKAAETFQKSILSQNYCGQFQMGAVWDLMLIKAYDLNFSGAEEMSKILQSESNWSPCVCAYLNFVFTLAQKKASKEDFEKLAMQVPELQQRIAGRAVPFEKYCARKANLYLSSYRLPLAHWEFIYYWNGFEILTRNPKMLRKVYENIREEWKCLKDGASLGDKHVYRLLIGVCLKHLGDLEKAEQMITSILKCLTDLGDDYNNIRPTAMYEMGKIREAKGELKEAKEMLLQAQANRKFLLENKVQMRIRCSLQQMDTK